MCVNGWSSTTFLPMMKKLAKDKMQRAKADIAYARCGYEAEMEQKALKAEAEKRLA